MEKILMTAIVTLLIPCAARAAGYGLEADRMEAGRRFDEQQLSAPLEVQVAGEFKRAADAKYNAEARDYSKLEVKAPPVPADEPEENAGKEEPAPATGGVMMSGVSSVKLVVILAMAALVVLLVLGGGTPLAAISPAGTAALFVAGAVAIGALVGYSDKVAAE
ncbi:MAG: hypothetical protein HY952_03735 [Elusimicrobia bacterium]|nr:hypothetical protein [Elusimicrobiota bacterium]